MSLTTSGIIFGIALFMILILFLNNRRFGLRSRKNSSLYVEALHLIIENNLDDALQKLKQTVKTDTDNIMAYIFLGDVLRRKGFPVKASKVHRNLLVRANLTKLQTHTILYHLVKDYHASGDLDKAVEVAERLLQAGKHDVRIKRMLIGLYEEKGAWDKAFFYRQSLNKWLKKMDQDILALYKVESGLQRAADGREHEARIRFREGVKLDKHCAAAYLSWISSYQREGRKQDALKVIKEFMHHNPNNAHLVMERLKTVLYDLGKYNDLESLLIPVIRKKPDHPAAHLFLMEMYQKQGKRDRALDLAAKTMEAYPDHVSARTGLMKLSKQTGQYERALNTAIQLIDENFDRQQCHTCVRCGYQTKDLIWRCPQCQSWNSFTEKT